MQNLLDAGDNAVSNALIAKTNISKKEALEIIENETWFDAKQALEIGLIDEILHQVEDKEKQIVQNNNVTLYNNFANSIIPHDVINKLKNERLVKLTNFKLKYAELNVIV